MLPSIFVEFLYAFLNFSGLCEFCLRKAYFLMTTMFIFTRFLFLPGFVVIIRELLSNRRRRRQGRLQVKNKLIFYKRNSRLSRSARYTNGSKNKLKLNMQRRHSVPNAYGNTKNEPSSAMFRKRRRTWSFHFVVLRRMTKKCTKIYNARAQLLFCSLNLLFGDVLVAFVVVVCLNSLLSFVTTLFCVYCDKKA